MYMCVFFFFEQQTAYEMRISDWSSAVCSSDLEALLAYLVRRLLENGANTSFVNRIGDPAVPVDDLIADPVEAARKIQPIGAPHRKIALPRDLFGTGRPNSSGLDQIGRAHV